MKKKLLPVPASSGVRDSDYENALEIFATQMPSKWLLALAIILVKQHEEDPQGITIDAMGLQLRTTVEGRKEQP